MPGKKKTIQQPIDRPLSRAYLRGFTGWSTAYPPGASDPTTLRVMENAIVDRNGAVAVRPGLRYLSYAGSPDLDVRTPAVPGFALGTPCVGSQELFYTADGSRALLFAVREPSGKVGFRALLFSGKKQAVHKLGDDRIGFRIPQGEEVLQFSKDTNYVKYLQINNRILALSDNGEAARLFYVGPHKLAKRLNSISVPEWREDHKLTVVHPDAGWIHKNISSTQVNGIENPSFEAGLHGWEKTERTGWKTTFSGGLPVNEWPMSVEGGPSAAYEQGVTTFISYQGVKDAVATYADLKAGWKNYGSQINRPQTLHLFSLPLRTNMLPAPLTDMSYGTLGWHSDPVWTADLSVSGSTLLVKSTGKEERFYAASARILEAVGAGERYRFAVDVQAPKGVRPEALVAFYSVDGTEIDTPLRVPMEITSNGRFTSASLKAPEGTVSMRLSLGGVLTSKATGEVRFANAVVCPDGEPTTSFDGGDGTDYFWTGEAYLSASVYHPPTDIEITSHTVPVSPNKAISAAIKVLGEPGVAFTTNTAVILLDKDRQQTIPTAADVAATGDNEWSVRSAIVPANVVGATTVGAQLRLTFKNVQRGQAFLVNEAMLVSDAAAVPDYFDGDTPDTDTERYRWKDVLLPHQSASIKEVLPAKMPAITAETPTAKTLVATGGATANKHKMAFFYTFENEVGESAPSQVVEIRISRPWSNWLWETASATGEPTGTATVNADLCADQLVCQLPQDVYDTAVADGALRWNLYVMAWSDEEPVPVTGLLAATRHIRADMQLAHIPAISWEDGGWLSITPARQVSIDEAVIPTEENRVNHSAPPRHRSGMVAGDRMVLVGDPNNLAGIRWSSNRAADSTNFTPSKGGGTKTLTSGNLDIPADVVLWQNPQSVDTITILCTGDNGRSVSHYMAPASVNQGGSGGAAVMGFEQVTGAPGTTGAYAAQVVNNTLYRPVDHALVKSTAANYNLNHKTASDDIANMWRALRSKQWIVADQLDNRLYLLVNNAYGEPLRDGCRGNEIWVIDIAAESPSWSRMLIQAASLKTFTVGVRSFMGVTTPEGLFYLDPLARVDDYVDGDGRVRQRPIPWLIESNTQGANRAHDAWAHLQQLVVTIGDFQGTMRYGIRGLSVHGKPIDVHKEFTDTAPAATGAPTWDVDDYLQIRRELKEWAFYAGSVQGKASSGHISAVQYRYAPISVNVGYEFGSVETFEYGRNTSAGPDGYSTNGVPVPFQDFARP